MPYLIKILTLYLLLFSLHSELTAESKKGLTIHLFCEANGKGLEKDRMILLQELSRLNCTVKCFDSYVSGPFKMADINIFVQTINKDYLHLAKRNWFIPNPEWFVNEMDTLKSIDLILCRTKEVERIFKRFKMPTYFLGFTSEDHYRKEIKQNPHRYFHLAGSSGQKGTKVIKAVWKRSFYLPFLTSVARNRKPRKLKNFVNYNTYLDDSQILYYQNEALVHLCPSETEGFGHYIMEAMSVGAVVITTNAPPMNEFITDPRFLVPYKETRQQRLAINYYVDELSFERKMWQLQKISKADLMAVGQANRARYLQLSKEFRENLRILIQSFP